MKKTTKETIEWHSIKTKNPITHERTLLQTNDGIFFGYWDKKGQQWYASNGSAWGHSLNSDTHVYYWAYCPKGVII